MTDLTPSEPKTDFLARPLLAVSSHSAQRATTDESNVAAVPGRYCG